jgi:integrase-like protein
VAKARKAVGTDARPVITLHGLRHTYATVLLEAGENPKGVQERLGHTIFTTTMDILPCDAHDAALGGRPVRRSGERDEVGRVSPCERAWPFRQSPVPFMRCNVYAYLLDHGGRPPSSAADSS